MQELSPKARALIEAGRGALRPSASDRARVTEALRERLGPGVLSAEQTASEAVTTASRFAGWYAWVGAAAASCLIAAAFVWGSAHRAHRHAAPLHAML